MFERGSYTLLILVCAIMYVFIFYCVDRLPLIKDMQYKCLSGCESKMCQFFTRNFRDGDYWLDPLGKTKMDPIKCIFTMYELSHLLFHLWIGYDYGLVTSIIISVGFEIFEHHEYNCGSILDLIWNLFGALIGVSLRIYQGTGT